jgi:sterol desaturase/sphingolipid hydroxylase (fatty acid hydroxylase superfamily)
MGDLTLLLTLKGAVFLASLLVFMGMEHVRPYAARSARTLAHLGRNLAFLPIVWIVGRLWVLPVTALAAQAPLGRPLALPEPLALLIHLLLLDLALYAWHRLCHEVPFLWRFHEVHHRDEAMDASTALRFHFGELFFSALFRGGIILLVAIPLTHVLIYEALVIACVVFHHSNWRLPVAVERRLSPYWVTPAVHWMHHHKKRRHTDSNYGVSTTLWDRVFGTYTPPRRTPAMPLGVEGTSGDLAFINLLKRPFQRRRHRV